MCRWLGVAVLVVAMMVAACGRQVTGLDAAGAGSIAAGHMLIRFRVAGPLDFTNVEYFIVFNTSGSGIEPYPQAFNTGFKNYSFALVVGGSQYTSSPLLFQYYLAPGTTSGLQAFRITIPPQLINYVPNSGGNPSGGEFTIDFDRSLLYGVDLSATASPSATAEPTTAAQETWWINFITCDTNNVPIDSMGLGGPIDTTFNLPIVTTRAGDETYTKPAGTATVSNLSAQLQGCEVINAPENRRRTSTRVSLSA